MGMQDRKSLVLAVARQGFAWQGEGKKGNVMDEASE
jgi:hypothetical protein